MVFKNILYLILVLLIQSYKWIEYQIMKLFESRVEKIVLETFASIGVVFEMDEGKDEKPKSIEGFDEQSVSEKSSFKEVIKVKVNDKEFFVRLANNGAMGLGESYMNGMWESDKISEIIRRGYRTKASFKYFNPWNRFLNYMQLSFFNLQTEGKAWEVGKMHYDLGNDLFESFLDPWMNYTCGYWARADNLNDAQVHKMELIANKLDLKPGMRVLDIGCGWGGLCKFLTKNYGVECVGISIAQEGVKYARESCKDLPVEFRLEDYRKINEKFDRVVSIGMFEAVGVHNYREYFKVAHRCMKDDGIFLLHTIGFNHTEMVRIEPWYHTYIFPNGCLPYYQDITKYTEGLFILEDWHNFGPDYAKTLQAWLANFKENWPTISHQYGDRFYRMWTYYLQRSGGAFQARMVHLWQIVLSKDGLENYRAAR